MLRTAGGDVRAPIMELDIQEPARFNPDRLEELCHRIGEVRAEAEVALALHRISELLPTLRTAMRDDEEAFLTALDTIVADAELIGMATLGRVARSVLDSFATNNLVALAATLARLERVGDRSIHAVWDLEDLSS
ncbi:hypothetical protein V8J82_08055 [Gymnodinialimonas sp. 2305UL16-5]|uniref:hypothetical protein n=1 Tax=Gymnodinialimonas mytili TaxID=3126503 RepID=UPI003097E1B3